MRLAQAHQLARELMSKHGVSDWRFIFDNARRRNGCCNYTDHQISLSRYYVKLNSDDRIKNTILHEIAHAICGSGHGHSSTWKHKAQEIGCTAERCTSGVVQVARKYKATCPSCGMFALRHRRGNGACGTCCIKYNGGRFDSSYILKWTLNEGRNI